MFREDIFLRFPLPGLMNNIKHITIGLQDPLCHTRKPYTRIYIGTAWRCAAEPVGSCSVHSEAVLSPAVGQSLPATMLIVNLDQLIPHQFVEDCEGKTIVFCGQEEEINPRGLIEWCIFGQSMLDNG